MKTLVLLYEVKITEKQFREFVRDGRGVGGSTCSATVMGRDVVLTGGGIAEENPDLESLLYRFRFLSNGEA